MENSVENPFWHFSLELYSKPGVEAHCLNFQEETGLNVNLLLLCIWTGGHGVQLTDEGFSQLLAQHDPWSHEVVRPLRAIRTRMKMPIGVVLPEDMEDLRHRIKALELEAERREQDFLYQALSAMPGRNARAADRFGVIRRNIGLYAKLKGKKLSQSVKQSVESILSMLVDG